MQYHKYVVSVFCDEILEQDVNCAIVDTSDDPHAVLQKSIIGRILGRVDDDLFTDF